MKKMKMIELASLVEDRSPRKQAMAKAFELCFGSRARKITLEKWMRGDSEVEKALAYKLQGEVVWGALEAWGLMKNGKLLLLTIRRARRETEAFRSVYAGSRVVKVSLQYYPPKKEAKS